MPGWPMAKPLISVDTIFTRALELLDADGAQALNARRLASELKCSTRTLYQQVGSRDQLIRALVRRHFSQLKLDFHEQETWESTAMHWCLELRDALLAHPYLTELMTFDDHADVASYVNKLLKRLVREGMNRRLAIECCRSLVSVTINYTIIEAQAQRQPPTTSAPDSGTETRARSFLRTIEWIIAGVRQESGLSHARRSSSQLAGRQRVT
jgi:AcrR family transcriptional regulator